MTRAMAGAAWWVYAYGSISRYLVTYRPHEPMIDSAERCGLLTARRQVNNAPMYFRTGEHGTIRHDQ